MPNSYGIDEAFLSARNARLQGKLPAKADKPVARHSVSLKIVVDGRMPGLNDYDAQNSNWRKNGKAKRLWSGLVAQAAQIAARGTNYDMVDIHYHWIEPNKKRDKDNIRFAAKFINDGIVKAGIIPDDGWKNVNNLSDSFSVDAERPRVEVTITPVEVA